MCHFVGKLVGNYGYDEDLRVDKGDTYQIFATFDLRFLVTQTSE